MSREGNARAIDAQHQLGQSPFSKRRRHLSPRSPAAAGATTKANQGDVRMKSARLTSIIAMILFVVAMPVSLAAQVVATQNHPHQYHRYQVK